METEKIVLRRERDFGQVFNAAFAFLKQEFKPLSVSIVTFVLPFMLLFGITLAFYYSSISGFSRYSHAGIQPLDFYAKFIGLILSFVFLGIMSQTMLLLTVICYLKLYLKTGESPSLNELFHEILKYFFRSLGAIILGGITICFGMVFCILPGIYLGVSLSLFLVALVIEDEGIGNAWSRSFQLTHMQWWWTFLIIVVCVVMIYALSMIFQIPAFILGISSALHNFKKFSEAGENPFGLTYIIYQSVTSAIVQLVYAIPLLVIAFHYFSLVEIRESPSLLQKIEEMGANE